MIALTTKEVDRRAPKVRQRDPCLGNGQITGYMAEVSAPIASDAASQRCWRPLMSAVHRIWRCWCG